MWVLLGNLLALASPAWQGQGFSSLPALSSRTVLGVAIVVNWGMSPVHYAPTSLALELKQEYCLLTLEQQEVKPHSGESLSLTFYLDHVAPLQEVFAFVVFNVFTHCVKILESILSRCGACIPYPVSLSQVTLPCVRYTQLSSSGLAQSFVVPAGPLHPGSSRVLGVCQMLSL